MIVFGPVSSRRLGRILGIDNIPAQHCSYSCVYCQLGGIDHKELIRQSFFRPGFIFDHVRYRVETLLNRDETIDYLTFVSSGEPTLDEYLAETIVLLKDLGIKVAVFSNASLIWHRDVQATLKLADWVSFKIDTTALSIWHQINCPVTGLELDRILEAMREFSNEFDGVLTTETRLLDKVNTHKESIETLVDYLVKLSPDKSYFTIPQKVKMRSDGLQTGSAIMTEILELARGRLPQLEVLTKHTLGANFRDKSLLGSRDYVVR